MLGKEWGTGSWSELCEYSLLRLFENWATRLIPKAGCEDVSPVLKEYGYQAKVIYDQPTNENDENLEDQPKLVPTPFQLSSQQAHKVSALQLPRRAAWLPTNAYRKFPHLQRKAPNTHHYPDSNVDISL